MQAKPINRTPEWSQAAYSDYPLVLTSGCNMSVEDAACVEPSCVRCLLRCVLSRRHVAWKVALAALAVLLVLFRTARPKAEVIVEWRDIGEPTPGLSYWTFGTLGAVVERYPELDDSGTNYTHNADLLHSGADSASGQVLDDIRPKINVSHLMEVQLARRNLVTEVCNQRSQELMLGRSLWAYKLDARHGLAYCPVPKAGWSSWKRLLFYINGVINGTDVEIGIAPDTNAGVVDTYSFEISFMQKMDPNNIFVFVFVRNPWVRLVSAYINKAVDWNYTRLMHTPCRWETMEPYNEPISFAQFLTCISEAGEDDAAIDFHWKPMWRLCDFCSIQYDYIGHMETIADDSRYILEKNGLNITFPRIFSSKAHLVSDVIVDWYKSVPSDVIQKLKKLYELDFLLHGYSDVPPGLE